MNAIMFLFFILKKLAIALGVLVLLMVAAPAVALLFLWEEYNDRGDNETL